MDPEEQLSDREDLSYHLGRTDATGQIWPDQSLSVLGAYNDCTTEGGYARNLSSRPSGNARLTATSLWYHDHVSGRPVMVAAPHGSPLPQQSGYAQYHGVAQVPPFAAFPAHPFPTPRSSHPARSRQHQREAVRQDRARPKHQAPQGESSRTEPSRDASKSTAKRNEESSVRRTSDAIPSSSNSKPSRNRFIETPESTQEERSAHGTARRHTKEATMPRHTVSQQAFFPASTSYHDFDQANQFMASSIHRSYPDNENQNEPAPETIIGIVDEAESDVETARNEPPNDVSGRLLLDAPRSMAHQGRERSASPTASAAGLGDVHLQRPGETASALSSPAAIPHNAPSTSMDPYERLARAQIGLGLGGTNAWATEGAKSSQASFAEPPSLDDAIDKLYRLQIDQKIAEAEHRAKWNSGS